MLTCQFVVMDQCNYTSCGYISELVISKLFGSKERVAMCSNRRNLGLHICARYEQHRVENV